jgi:transcription elongation factor Elf1
MINPKQARCFYCNFPKLKKNMLIFDNDYFCNEKCMRLFYYPNTKNKKYQDDKPVKKEPVKASGVCEICSNKFRQNTAMLYNSINYNEWLEHNRKVKARKKRTIKSKDKIGLILCWKCWKMSQDEMKEIFERLKLKNKAEQDLNKLDERLIKI